MPDRQQLQEYYRSLSDNDLAGIALTAELTSEAREVIGHELQDRGLKDLSSFKGQIEEDAVVTNPARYNQVSWEMEQRWKASIAIAGLVVGAWVSAATLPIDILNMDRTESLGSKLQIIGLLGAAMALSVYLGLRARREGRRLAFYLRAVVTLVILCASIAIVLASRWMAW